MTLKSPLNILSKDRGKATKKRKAVSPSTHSSHCHFPPELPFCYSHPAHWSLSATVTSWASWTHLNNNEVVLFPAKGREGWVEV